MTIREEQQKENVITTTALITNEILTDIYNAKEDLFNRAEYYSKKYQHYSTVDRNINLTVGYNVEEQKPCVRVYAEDDYSKTRIDIVFNKACNEIVSQDTKAVMKEQKVKDHVTVETPTYSEEFKTLTNRELMKVMKSSVEDTINKQVDYIEEIGYTEDGLRIFKVYINE